MRLTVSRPLSARLRLDARAAHFELDFIGHLAAGVEQLHHMPARPRQPLRLVAACKLLAVHAHTAGVERAGDQPAHDIGTEAFFTDVLLGAAAAVENPGAGAEAFIVDGVRDLGERSKARGQFENAAERAPVKVSF